MVLPKINIKPLLDELMRSDIKSLLRNARNESKIIKDWNLLLEKLKLVSGKLARGEKAAETELNVIKECAVSLSRSAAEFGSMVPGPIGIVCSVGLAIGCLIPPIDIVCFFLNLLGCIPFAKAGTKACKPIIDNIIKDFMKAPAIKSTLIAGKGLSKGIKYNEEFAKRMYMKMFPESASKMPSNIGHFPAKTPTSIMNKSAGADKCIFEKQIHTPFKEGIEKQHKDLNYIPEYFTNNPSNPYSSTYLFIKFP